MPVLTSLPNELLTQIFEYLPYWDLKLRLPLVCSHFADLIDDRSGRSDPDRALFRDEPISQQQPPKHVEINPTLNTIDFMANLSDDDLIILRNTTSRFAIEIPDSILDENVVSPAVTLLRITLIDAPWSYDLSMRTVDGTALSIADFIAGIISYLDDVDIFIRDDINDIYRSSNGEIVEYKKVWESINVGYDEDSSVYLEVVVRSNRCDSELGGRMP